jgi:hypothetical protein
MRPVFRAKTRKTELGIISCFHYFFLFKNKTKKIIQMTYFFFSSKQELISDLHQRSKLLCAIYSLPRSRLFAATTNSTNRYSYCGGCVLFTPKRFIFKSRRHPFYMHFTFKYVSFIWKSRKVCAGIETKNIFFYYISSSLLNEIRENFRS